MSTDREEKLRIFFSEEYIPYFKQTSYAKIGYVFLFAGIIISYLSFTDYIGNYFLLGLAFFVLGLFLVRKKLSGLFAFSEDEIQGYEDVKQLLDRDINENVLPKAMDVLNLNLSVIEKNTVFIFKVPVYENISGIDSEDILKKQFEEGGFFYSVWEIHLLIASQNYISYYSCVYDWPHNQCINELTNEFYYNDIASVKSEFYEKEILYKDEEEPKPENLKTIIISNVSGDKITFVIEKPYLQLPSDFQKNIDDIVKKMRLLFRNKRFPEKNTYSGDDIDFEIDDRRNND